jgi:hypothetical protein
MRLIGDSIAQEERMYFPLRAVQQVSISRVPVNVIRRREVKRLAIPAFMVLVMKDESRGRSAHEGSRIS